MLLQSIYSLHRKKVYTCGKAKYSKSRGLEDGFGAPPTFHLAPSVLSTQIDRSVYFFGGRL